jgi:hypothetical protein
MTEAKMFARRLTGDSVWEAEELALGLGRRLELVDAICDAVRPVIKKVKQPQALAIYAMMTRAPSVIALVKELPRIPDWLYVTLLAPELDERLRAEMGQVAQFAGAAAVLRGFDVRKILRKNIRLPGSIEALALAGHPDEKDLFPMGSMLVKSLYKATAPGKSADRIAALGRLAEYGIVAYAHLMGDADPAVAAAALAKLKHYTAAEQPGRYNHGMWHGIFLVRAGERIASGVSAGDLRTIKAVHALIPNAPPLPAAKATKTGGAPPELQQLMKAMHERACLRVDESVEKDLPRPTAKTTDDGTLVTAGFTDTVLVGADGQVRAGKKKLGTVAEATAAIEAELAVFAALLAKAREAANLMTAIKKKQGEGSTGQFGRGSVYRLEKFLEVFVLGDRGYKVRIETGEVFEWRGRQPKPGPKLHEDLDDAILELKAELRARHEEEVRRHG